VLEAARLEYARNGRNVEETARVCGIHSNSVSTHRDKGQWDKWADDRDRRVAEADLDAEVQREVKSKAKRLRAAVGIATKIAEVVPTLKLGRARLADLSAALEKTNKVIELLTGGPTDRPDHSSVLKAFLELPDDEQRAVIDGLRSIASGGR
jgi:hypothetical protein